ncbi:oxidoreductase [Kitasatospora aureofaciens]|uniref:oxidoreductase n=1 Tax=Kitasatospora aureofaciens TaxID=1894 RepID=UPI001C472E2F|nr:oxidoreductase [Kitasatospora aureofaciens]MBV6703296.1 SDR family NAD(P)-dependent oxidoreductase [Kitasatospora aureofaciens]
MSTPVQPRKSVTGKVWLITGANSGFGQAIAEAAVAAGDTVVAAARRPETLEALAAAHPGQVVPVRLDVTDPAQISAAVADTLLRFGRIDVLVNNAGRGLIGAVEEYTDRELRDLMELHFFGPAALTRAVLPHMRAQGAGAVVQMSSMGGRFSFPGVGAYSATKFALEGLSEALAQEVAGFGVKVLIVEPGAFRTGFAGGGALAQATPIAAYEPTVGPVRTGLPDSDGKQPGDPVKAAATILAALDAEHTPLRLALGTDAIDAILGNLDSARKEAEEWAQVSRGTDFAN